jgi:hypothetical protein
MHSTDCPLVNVVNSRQLWHLKIHATSHNYVYKHLTGSCLLKWKAQTNCMREAVGTSSTQYNCFYRMFARNVIAGNKADLDDAIDNAPCKRFQKLFVEVMLCLPSVQGRFFSAKRRCMDVGLSLGEQTIPYNTATKTFYDFRVQMFFFIFSTYWSMHLFDMICLHRSPLDVEMGSWRTYLYEI